MTTEEIKRNPGGSAFPVHPNVNLDLDKRWCGMTLRDYFAAKAMQALLSADRYTGIIGVNNYEHCRAEDAYKMADAMLKARQHEQT